MSKRVKPCITCGIRPKALPAQRCSWCLLPTLPIERQIAAAEVRLQRAEAAPDFARRARVPVAEWPDGYRWCSGCQSYVPLVYTTGSRCKACASKANHRAHVQREYGLGPGEYEALFKLQGGRCALCLRVARSRRLAVDHDHETGAVRGLLCADSERGCNHAILGNLEAAAQDTPLAMALRLVEYLQHPPYEHIGHAAAPETPAAPPDVDEAADPFEGF
jgi:hypothetical protein